MTNLQRLTGKIFGETATATGDDPQIGQFGSALNGTYVGTTDVATIQGLPAWSNGFIDSVTPNEQFPPLPEMTGFGKVLSYQTAYILQKGVPEWDAGTTYYIGDFAKGVGEGKLYVSLVDNNLNHVVSDTTYWKEFSLNDKADVDLANTSPTISFATTMNSAGIRTVVETYADGTSWYRIWSDKWCEQGGFCEGGAAGSGSTFNTVELIKSYRDTNYTITLAGCMASGNQIAPLVHTAETHAKAEDEFTLIIYSAPGSYWRTAGYIN